MNALDYRMGFGYKRQDDKYYGPTGSVGLYHLGNDYYAPLNSPLILQGVTIGLSGNSGTAGGPHVHVAKWKPGNVAGGYYVKAYNRSYFDPSDVRDVTGTVSEVGTGTDAGKFIRIQADNGFIYEFFHLNKQYAKVGQKIGVNMPYIDQATLDDFVRWKAAGMDAQQYKALFESAPGWSGDATKMAVITKEEYEDLKTWKETNTAPVDKEAQEKLNKIKEIVL